MGELEEQDSGEGEKQSCGLQPIPKDHGRLRGGFF
jgi:hypothetical protein